MIELINIALSTTLIMRDFYYESKKELEGIIVPEILRNREDAYFKTFKKAPFDTGLSYDKTTVRSRTIGNLESFAFLIDVDINTPYASLFAEPEDNTNPNFKYGQRNTADAMINIFIKDNNL